MVTSPPTTSGKTFPGDRTTLTLELKPDTVPRLRAGGFRVISTDRSAARPLPAARRRPRGQHQARPARCVYDLDVPDFAKEQLTMSGLALTSASSGADADDAPKDPLAKLLPGPLTTLSRLRGRRRDGALRRGLRQHRQAGRTRSTSTPRSRPRAGRRCSRRARNATAASWPAGPAATASRRACR